MNDLAVLTPPFLVCAVVVVAIVAFLRHEMGRARPNRRVGGDDNSALAPTTADELDDAAGSDSDAAASGSRDG
jgi:hypothetical protein